jgi:hypothetical protein
MTQEFVPYEQALALKELGFDEPCFRSYDKSGNLVRAVWQEIECSTPTFSQAFRWFREKYNIDAWFQPFVAQNKNDIPYLPDESYSYFIFKDGVFVCDKVDLLDPEEAELACLIKLIEIVKENK